MKKYLPTIFFGAFMLLPFIAGAQQSQTEQQIKNVTEGIMSIIRIAAPLVMGIIIAVAGFKYMAKPKDERSSEDTKQVWGQIVKTIIGAAIIFSATYLVELITDWVS